MIRSKRTVGRRSPLAGVLLVAVVLGAGLGPAVASAEQAWVRGGLRLNLRTGPGQQYRILGVVETGDGVRILRRGEEWTQIRLSDGREAWIPKGYLQPEPPPTIRLEQLEDEVTSLRAQLEESTASKASLQQQNEDLAGRDGDQRAEIDRLTMDNMKLRAGKRWPEWITGASVLAVGMILGAILHRNSTRRPSSRIRL